VPLMPHRALLHAELDACFSHPSGIEREDVDHIVEAFAIVKGKDEVAFEEYRTKGPILEVHHAMAKTIHTGEPYRTTLEPPPADPSLRHPQPIRPEWARS